MITVAAKNFAATVLFRFTTAKTARFRQKRAVFGIFFRETE